jgi:putative transposase
VPLAVVVDGANRNDHKLLAPTLEGLRAHRPGANAAAHGLCLDKGYDYPVTRELARTEGYLLHLRRRGEDRVDATPGWKPRRWVVERSFSWLHRARRLATRWEKRAANYLALIHLASALITLRSLAG